MGICSIKNRCDGYQTPKFSIKGEDSYDSVLIGDYPVLRQAFLLESRWSPLFFIGAYLAFGSSSRL